MLLTAEPSLQGYKFPLHEVAAASHVVEEDPRVHAAYGGLENSYLLEQQQATFEQRTHPVLGIPLLGWFHDS